MCCKGIIPYERNNMKSSTKRILAIVALVLVILMAVSGIIAAASGM